MSIHYGAQPSEWDHWQRALGLGKDLLPVVSNINATISPQSKIKKASKVPSKYNSKGHAAGFQHWTKYETTDADIAVWRLVSDYGICVQTRRIRAIDVDIEGKEYANAVRKCILEFLRIRLPERNRLGSSKFLLAFDLPGEWTKRIIRTPHGIIEFLATGQQFVAHGMHAEGVKYNWRDGLPDKFPVLSDSVFDALWQKLEAEFGTEPSTMLKKSVDRRAKLSEAHENDPLATFLINGGHALSTNRDGGINIRCPFAEEHTTPLVESATTYWPAHTGGFQQGHFKCLHAHCAHRLDTDFIQALGFESADDDIFESIPDDEPAPAGPLVLDDEEGAESEPTDTAEPLAFPTVSIAELLRRPRPTWLIRGVIPRAELVMMYGEPGAGKSFMAIDMGMAIARGVPWRDRDVEQGAAVYVCGEGLGGFRNRVEAYVREHNLPMEKVPFHVITDIPNLVNAEDYKKVIRSVKALNRPVKILFFDPLASVVAGADENSAKDMTLVLKHCKRIAHHLQCVVVLVHHAGKNSEKGARGSSVFKGAMDTEMEVMRFERSRALRITKQKDFGDELALSFELQTIGIGMDDQGVEITSCVVKHIDLIKRTGKKRSPTGMNAKTVLSVIHESMDLSDGTAHILKVIEAATNRMAYDPQGGRDRRRDVIVQALEALQAQGFIVIEGMTLKLTGDALDDKT